MSSGPDQPFLVVVDYVSDSSSPAGAETRTPGGTAQARSLFGSQSKDLDFDQVKKDWSERIEQVHALAQVADSGAASSAGFKLSEIDLGLTITAEGRLAFIASASASAMIQVKFTR